MTHFRIVHHMEGGSLEEFWKVFFDEPYNEEVYKRIGVQERVRLKFEEDAETIRFAIRVVPKSELPALIKRVVGGHLGYTEISTYYKGKDEIDVRIEPSLLKERTRMRGTYRVVAVGPDRLERTFEGDLHVDIPIVGKKIEETILEDVRRSYGIAAQVTSEWLKRGSNARSA